MKEDASIKEKKCEKDVTMTGNHVESSTSITPVIHRTRVTHFLSVCSVWMRGPLLCNALIRPL